jgi:hypothetical protein
MHLLVSSLPLLSLVAGTLHPRDAASITNVLTGITNQINAVDAIVKSYTGGSVDALTAASDKLLSAITSGTATAKASAPLSDNDAESIAMSVVTLNTSTAAVVDDLIAKKSLFDSQSPPVGGTVLKSLQDQAAASQDFATALTALVPADIAAVAASLSADIAANLARGIKAYGDDASQPPPPPTTKTSGGAPPPTSATSTSGVAVPPPSGSPGSATGTHPHSTGTAPPPSCSLAPPPHGSKTPNATYSATATPVSTPPATYTPGSGAGMVGAWSGVVVGVVALVPVLFL